MRITPAGAGKTRQSSASAYSDTDHPRGCGENRYAGRQGAGQLGSPPRVRGKPKAAPLAKAAPRITPAGAGKTVFVSTIVTICEDHPRGCGENAAAMINPRRPAGSPPRVRGKPLVQRSPSACHRITPAGAGKTLARNDKISRSSDHPRGCGENSSAKSQNCVVSGSPPRVRGKLFTKPKYKQQHRITPAGAGKTRQKQDKLCRRQDHPRGCGENNKGVI